MGAVEFVRCRLNTSLTEPLADPGIVIAEPHEANRIVVGQLVEEFLFAFEFEADHRGLGDPNPDKPVMTIARARSCPGIFCCDLDHSPETRGGGTMAATTTHFPIQKAPCGRMHEGDHHVESDDDGLSFDDRKYSCGCREIRHVYHDGCVRIRTIRHDGKVLRDERCGEHEAFEV